MKTIYCVYGAAGEYDDWHQWPIVVVLSEEKATVLVDEFEKRGAELKAKLDAVKHPEYPRAPKGKTVSEETWEEYMKAVDKAADDRDAIHTEHPSSAYCDSVNLSASYSYEPIVLLEE